MTPMHPFDLQGPSPRSLMVLFILVVLVPVAVTALGHLVLGGSGRPLNLTVLGPVVVVSVLVFVGLAIMSSRRALVVTTEGMTVRTSFYKVFVKRSALKVDEIRACDSKHEPACMLSVRTNGVSIPGYQSGWFRTRSREKAFVAMGEGDCVLIPTTEGFSILLSTRDAAKAADALKVSLSED